MKNLLPVGLVCLLVSCAKTNDKSDLPVQEAKKEICTFGIESFNLAKRATLSEEASRKPQGNGNGNGNGNGGGGTVTPPPPGAPVILLDFDGHIVSGTSWNYSGDIVCAPSNLMTAEMSKIIERVSNDYSPFNVIVTLDENLFNAAPIYRRTRVIITETWEWFGQAGGTSFIGSFVDGSGAPCFVFSSLLNYNASNIAEAASHEAGHTLGLYHQAVYSGCTKTAEYNTGQGYGETGWAPIMGNAYSQNLSLWHRGLNAVSCNSTQDDVNYIANIVGWKVDDHANGFTGSTSLLGSAPGLINSSNDQDFFTFYTSTPGTISVVPSNTGANNAGANTDLVLKVYNSQGSLLATVNDASVLHASAYIGAGTYYVSVSTAPNANTDTYGMLGKYTISLN